MPEPVNEVSETVTSDLVKEGPQTVTAETEKDNSAALDMELEQVNTSDQNDGSGPQSGSRETNLKREREEENKPEEGENSGEKKQKVDKSMEEQRPEESVVSETVEGEKEKVTVSVGPKSFGSSVEMFDYFYELLHFWTPNLNLNKYEHLMLLDLLKKGHLEPEKKIGKGIQTFQVRYHPQYDSRCFFLIREDDSVDDFSFRKCVDHILPLPENMQVKHDGNKALGGSGNRGGKFGGGGGGRGGGRGRGRGGWRGGKSRN